MNSFLLWQLSAAYHCSILLLVSGCIPECNTISGFFTHSIPPFCCKTSLKSPATRGFSGKLTPSVLIFASQRRQLQASETARTAGRSGGCGGACDAMPLSCFFFRPAKVCRKRLTSGFNPLVGTGTRFFPERRTQGVLAALGVGLFEELLPHDSGRQPPLPAGTAAHRTLRVHLG